MTFQKDGQNVPQEKSILSQELCISKEKQIRKLGLLENSQKNRVMNMWTVAAENM